MSLFYKRLAVLTFFFAAAFSAPSLAKGTLHKVSAAETPRSTEIVSQQVYASLPSYKQIYGLKGRVKWRMCGQAAFATAINVLNNKPASPVSQLQYFDEKLSALPGSNYTSTVTNPYREANGENLAAVINKRMDYIAEKYTNKSREQAKSDLIGQINSRSVQQIVALTQLNGTWGHFVVVYEIYSDPTGPGGGYVKYADPWTGKVGKMGYTTFLDGMRDAGTSGRYSFWTVRARK